MKCEKRDGGACLQEWTRWEDDCGRLSRLLDDVEAFISSGEPEASDEKLAEHRLDACQVKHVTLHRTVLCSIFLLLLYVP